MTPTPQPLNMHRDRLKRLFERISKNVCTFGMDIEAELKTYSDNLYAQHFTSDEPCFDEDTYKAEQYEFYEDDLRSAETDWAAFAVTALYHHWERSVKWLIARKCLPYQLDEVLKADLNKLRSLLKSGHLPSTCEEALDVLDCARLIANTVKHGKGSSADKLRGECPDLFKRPWGDDIGMPLLSNHSLHVIWVRQEHVESTRRAIEQFWDSLPEDYFPPTPMTTGTFLDPDL